MKLDYLIIGQGLAGSILAYKLLNKNKKVLVIDHYNPNSSSNIAAGVVNSIVFKRLTKSWETDSLFEPMVSFYKSIETSLNTKIFFPKEVHKIFVSETEIDFWKKKSQEPELIDFLDPEVKHIYDKNMINFGLGIGVVKKGGYLAVKRFIDLMKNYFLENNALLNDFFSLGDLKISNNIVNYKDIQAEKIIFTEGSQAVYNKLFPELRFKLTKGEILTIKTKNFVNENVINKGVFILPLEKNVFRVGSTYDWQNLDEIPTVDGKNQIIEKLEKVLLDEYEILDHKAGVRPNTYDRRPFIGSHKDHNNVLIFNGLGSKGVLNAPFLADKFIDSIELNKDLEVPEADIKRIYRKLALRN